MHNSVSYKPLAKNITTIEGLGAGSVNDPRCNRHGSPKKCLSAVIARADRSWLPPLCSRRTPSRLRSKLQD